LYHELKEKNMKNKKTSGKINSNTYRSLHQNKNSQMIVLMGLLLAISVLAMSSLATEISNLNIVVSSERSTSPLTEFICIRETFGKALNHNLVDDIEYDGKLKLMFYGDFYNITDAFNQTRDEFYTLELQHDNLFDAIPNKYWYSHKSDDGNYVYRIDVTISLDNGNTYITEDILYSIICTPKISP